MLFNPLDYTTVFLSYDEPNCEENYRHLLSLNPQALRVHGVKGSDTAHKEVAKLSKTDSVIIVDGDNFVKPNFFNTTLDLPYHIDLNTSVLSFSGRNSINGLQYGNGGIKVWPVSLLLNMKTHEATEGEHSIDFDCSTYIELNTVASDVNIHYSPLQAFRSGYREGIKLMLENEKIVSFDNIDKYNLDRLWMWCHVGSDIENGQYSMAGTRLAMSTIYDIDYLKINDHDYVNQLVTDKLTTINHPIFSDVLSKEDSRRIRENFINPKRSDIDFKTNSFIEFSESFRESSKCTDMNKVIMMCTTGRDKPYSKFKIQGSKLGKDYKSNYSNLYDYVWLKEQYDRFYTDTI